MNFTYGAELEFADVKYGQPLPEGTVWNKQDYSLVNSNGVANCPIGKHWPYGGEINTKPTDTVEEQVQVFQDVLAILDPKPVINYRCNLHIHVGVKGLKDDLKQLKDLLWYVNEYQHVVFMLVEPIPMPKESEYLTNFQAFQGAMKRYRRRLQSHQTTLNPAQVSRMMAAETPEEFYLEHFVKSWAGVPQKHLAQRCGINLRSLWENPETIEFRHFPGTLDPNLFRNCLLWCERFMQAALYTKKHPLDIFNNWQDGKLEFPKFEKYDHRLETGYLLTGHHVPTAQRVINIQNYVEALNARP